MTEFKTVANIGYKPRSVTRHKPRSVDNKLDGLRPIEWIMRRSCHHRPPRARRRVGRLPSPAVRDRTECEPVDVVLSRRDAGNPRASSNRHNIGPFSPEEGAHDDAHFAATTAGVHRRACVPEYMHPLRVRREQHAGPGLACPDSGMRWDGRSGGTSHGVAFACGALAIPALVIWLIYGHDATVCNSGLGQLG